MIDLLFHNVMWTLYMIKNYKIKTQNTINLNWLIKGFKIFKINKLNLNKLIYLNNIYIYIKINRNFKKINKKLIIF